MRLVGKGFRVPVKTSTRVPVKELKRVEGLGV